MKRIVAAAAFLLALCASDVALALAQRTFVASIGSDTWPCSRTQPCRSFAAAIGQTNSGGEVVVLDSAGYGPVSIFQSISILQEPGGRRRADAVLRHLTIVERNGGKTCL